LVDLYLSLTTVLRPQLEGRCDMDNMTYFLLSLPIISLFVERILEIFDLLIVRTIFPLWRSNPLPAPEMIIRLPDQLSEHTGNDALEKPLENKVHQEADRKESDANDTENKIVHSIGASKLEMKIGIEQAVEFQNQEMEFYYRQLIYYLTRYGVYLGDKMSASSKDIKSWDVPSKLSLFLERYIASLEKIFDKEPYSNDTIKDLLNYKPRLAIPTDNVTITRLEVLADYCYLRNQRTHMVFSLWKQRLYSLLGVAMGIFIVHIMFDMFDLYQLYQLFQQTHPDTFSPNMMNHLSTVIKTSLPFLMQNQAPFVPPIVLVTGVGVGFSSQPIHEFLYRSSRSGLVRRPPGIMPVETRNVP